MLSLFLNCMLKIPELCIKMSNSPQLVNFAIGLVVFVLHLFFPFPMEKWSFLGKCLRQLKLQTRVTFWNNIFWGWWEWHEFCCMRNNMNTIPSCNTEKYCRPKACFCCTCTEVLTPVDQLKPGDMSALHRLPTVHCDVCMPWKMITMAKITLIKNHRWP